MSGTVGFDGTGAVFRANGMCDRARRMCKASSGSTMVESAIYFPLIVLAVMFTIYMLINMYSMTALRANLHILVRSESAAKIGTTDIRTEDETSDRYRRAAEANTVEMREGRQFAATYVEAESGSTYYGGRLTRRRGIRAECYGRAYLIDETDLARIAHTLSD